MRLSADIKKLTPPKAVPVAISIDTFYFFVFFCCFFFTTRIIPTATASATITEIPITNDVKELFSWFPGSSVLTTVGASVAVTSVGAAVTGILVGNACVSSGISVGISVDSSVGKLSISPKYPPYTIASP